MKITKIIVALSILAALLGSCTFNLGGGSKLSWPAAEWTVTSPEQQGMDSQTLLKMVDTIAEKKINLHSLLIARNGSIVLEAYFDPYQPETAHQIASITKSVIGTLVGIAIAEGKIENVDTPVLSFFPDRTVANLDERKQALTLRHLLTLTDGFRCDFATTETAMENSPDWTQFVLDLPMKYAPGEQWYYCSSSVHLLSAILSKATGQDARVYANEKLFKPLGIGEVPLERWPSDPQGVTMGSAALSMAPRDLAKYALLYARGGKWNGIQIVPEEWVQESLNRQAYAGTDAEFGGVERGYGYLWSIFPSRGYVSALGMGGQHIHIKPDQDLVVIFNASTMTNVFLFELLNDYIIPSVQADAPLAENAPAAQALADRLAQLTHSQQPIPPLPEVAGNISGRVYHLEENVTGWKNLELRFNSETDTAQMVIDGGEPIVIGLDNLYRVSTVENLGDVAARGYWKDDDTFVIVEEVLGIFNLEFETKIAFRADTISMTMRNTFFGGIVAIKGNVAD